MIRIKTLSFPLIAAMMASTVPSAHAALGLALNSEKTYRQTKKSVDFKGGQFSILLQDGNGSYIGGCQSAAYYAPGFYVNSPCSPGTSGYLSAGELGGADNTRPYLIITGLVPALVVAPKEPRKVQLVAAPASTLPRPSGGFTDDSAAVYYNLHTNDVREYGLTSYFLNRNYTRNQRGKFESDIKPGAYRYSFPRLSNPDLPAIITPVIFPMPEGYTKKNNQKVGFKFDQVNQNRWTKSGFIKMSYSEPNRIRWSGITPNVAYAAADDLYFSIRALQNPNNPQNSNLVRSSAIFPGFVNGAGASRILLANPFVKQFIVPPIIPSGTRAMVELELERDFQTGGVTYDFSTRRFQIPVIFIDSYVDYASTYLAKTNKKNQHILADPDKDGFNNLNEWILGSAPADRASVPPEVRPDAYQAVDVFGDPTWNGSYFGFNVDVKRDTDPAVRYILQRSTDGGKTWSVFKSEGTDLDDPNDPTLDEPFGWDVNRVTTVVRGVTTTQIQVRSKNLLNNPPVFTEPNLYVQPPYSVGHLYRVKIVLAKKAAAKKAAAQKAAAKKGK